MRASFHCFSKVSGYFGTCGSSQACTASLTNNSGVAEHVCSFLRKLLLAPNCYFLHVNFLILKIFHNTEEHVCFNLQTIPGLSRHIGEAVGEEDWQILASSNLRISATICFFLRAGNANLGYGWVLHQKVAK